MPFPALAVRSLSVTASAVVFLWVASYLACLVSPAADPVRGGGGEVAKAARVPWPTSRVVGAPEPPPPFKVVRAFPNLKFEHPLLMARCPGSDRLFVGEQAGVLYSFKNEPDARPDLFFDIRKEIKTVGQLAGAKEVESVYGLV